MCRESGISDATYCVWKSEYVGMETSDTIAPYPESVYLCNKGSVDRHHRGLD